MIFYRISELMLASLIQGYDKKTFHFKNEKLTEILQAVRYHIFYVLIPYIYLLKLSWIVKCLFLRNMEPLIFVEQLDNEGDDDIVCFWIL